MFLKENCKTKTGRTEKGICKEEDKNYTCNRMEGHKGKHHAHAGEGNCCHVWENVA